MTSPAAEVRELSDAERGRLDHAVGQMLAANMTQKEILRCLSQPASNPLPAGLPSALVVQLAVDAPLITLKRIQKACKRARLAEGTASAEAAAAAVAPAAATSSSSGGMATSAKGRRRRADLPKTAARSDRERWMTPGEEGWIPDPNGRRALRRSAAVPALFKLRARNAEPGASPDVVEALPLWPAGPSVEQHLTNGPTKIFYVGEVLASVMREAGQKVAVLEDSVDFNHRENLATIGRGVDGGHCVQLLVEANPPLSQQRAAALFPYLLLVVDSTRLQPNGQPVFVVRYALVPVPDAAQIVQQMEVLFADKMPALSIRTNQADRRVLARHLESCRQLRGDALAPSPLEEAAAGRLKPLLRDRLLRSAIFTPAPYTSSKEAFEEVLQKAANGHDMPAVIASSLCVVCHRPAAQVCPSCEHEFYCSDDCRQQHRPDHEDACKKEAAATAASNAASAAGAAAASDDSAKHKQEYTPTPPAALDSVQGDSVVVALNQPEIGYLSLINLRQARGLTTTQTAKAQPNVHGKSTFVVKVQVPLNRTVGPVLIYDRERSFQTQVTPQSPAARALTAITHARGWLGAKLYFFAKREGPGLRIFTDRFPNQEANLKW